MSDSRTATILWAFWIGCGMTWLLVGHWQPAAILLTLGAVAFLYDVGVRIAVKR